MRKHTKTFHASKGFKFSVAFIPTFSKIRRFQNRHLRYTFQTRLAEIQGLVHPYFLYENESLQYCIFFFFFFFFYLLYLELGFFLTVIYLTVANLAPLEIWIHCQVIVGSQYSIRLPSLFQFRGGLTIHSLVKGLLNQHRFEIRPPKQLDYRCCHHTRPSYDKRQMAKFLLRSIIFQVLQSGFSSGSVFQGVHFLSGIGSMSGSGFQTIYFVEANFFSPTSMEASYDFCVDFSI